MVNSKQNTTRAVCSATLLGAAIDIGARMKGCAEAPDVIEKTFKNQGIPWRFQKIVHHSNSKSKIDIVRETAEFSNTLASEIYSAVCSNQQFAVIGGDHSCAIGTWSGAALAIRQKSNLGLIWVDAHMDCHTLESTPSGALHGMPLATLLGFGADLLTDIGFTSAKVLPKNVCLIGVRSFEPAEAELLQNLGVQIFFMEDIQKLGLTAVFDRAINIVSENTLSFGISIDLDVIEPQQAPGVGTPVANGLQQQELITCVKNASDHHRYLGMEIAEYNPYLDERLITANIVTELLLAGCIKC